jgi:hypothetical protein
MLVVRLEIWPKGDEKKAREIARCMIKSGADAGYAATFAGEKPKNDSGPWGLIHEVLSRSLGKHAIKRA